MKRHDKRHKTRDTSNAQEETMVAYAPAFHGCWTPAEVFYLLSQGEINGTEFALLTIINALSNPRERIGCYASNNYLAARLGVTRRWIIKVVTKLRGMGLLRSSQKRGKRFLTVSWFQPVRASVLKDTALVSFKTPIEYLLRKYKREGVRKTDALRPRGKQMFYEEYQSSSREKNSTKHKDCATKLKKWVASQHFPISQIRNNWANQFRLLAKEIPQERIDKALDWYCENATKKTKPRLLTGRQFREHFVWLEDIMRQEIREVSPMASAIAERLSYLVWPKGSEKDLPTAVQLTIDNYKPFVDWIQREETNDGKEPIHRLMRYLNDVLPGPRKMADSWMHKVWDRIHNWDEWNGNLRSEALTIDGKRFQSYLRELANEYSGNFSKLIPKLMEMYDTHAN